MNICLKCIYKITSIYKPNIDYAGDFVLVENIEEGDKVKAEIISILYKEQIKYIKEEGKW